MSSNPSPTKNLSIILSAAILEKQTYAALSSVISQISDLDLSIIRKPCSDCVELVKGGSADVGIIYQKRGTEDSALTVTHLMDVPMALVASAKHSNEWNPFEQTLGGSRPFYVNQPRCAFYSSYQEYLQTHHLPPRKAIVMGETEMIIQAVIDSIGISFLPYCCVESYIKSGMLRQIQMPDFTNNIYVALIIKKAEPLNGPATRFCELLVQNVNAAS